MLPKTPHVMCPFPAVKPCLSACNAPCHNARVLCIDIVRLGVLVAQTTVAGGAASVLDVGLFGNKNVFRKWVDPKVMAILIVNDRKWWSNNRFRNRSMVYDSRHCDTRYCSLNHLWEGFIFIIFQINHDKTISRGWNHLSDLKVRFGMVVKSHVLSDFQDDFATVP